ncbi:MAG TPA: phosphatidylserine decarboxylase [Candidatus Binataceae bacterium]|nr:phosphatidylserine decarboxylase [Candidatus Binataceae bacterium]
MASEPDTARYQAGALAARIGAAVGIAGEGVMISGAVSAIGVCLFLVGFRFFGLIAVAFAVAVGMFFRDPDRSPPRTGDVVISGADGKVTDVADAVFPGETGRMYHRVSVFMSPLNVHVNRAVAGGEVTMIEHTHGEFRAAFRDDASLHNERNLIVLTDPKGRIFGMLQVAGYLARRIVCRLRVHDRVEAGQRVGLIMFGSRVDHFFPAEFTVQVRIGDRVRAGETVLGAVES